MTSSQTEHRSMDIVYLVKHDKENDSEELRYSLRSLRNVPHDKVIIVGEKPSWVKNVIFIPVVQSSTKPKNWTMNLKAAIKNEYISEDFLMMNDDFFIMKKITKMPTLHFGHMTDVIAQYCSRYPEGSDYIDKMIKLNDVLIQRNYPHPLSYELHVPMILNKNNVQKLYTNVDGAIYQFRTYYGNYFNVGGEQCEDVKIFVDQSHNPASYNSNAVSYLERQHFLSTTGGSFKRGVPGEFVRKKFSNPSIYES